MPNYRSLTLSLISQYDILTIPEFAPRSIIPDPFTDSSNFPTLVDPSADIVSVYIPTYPSSRFWLTYSVSPPFSPGLLFYFKLYINGSCVVSWGCGEEDGYKGKTMFGLYASRGGRGIEARVLAFSPPRRPGDLTPEFTPGNLDHIMEIRVYRSKGRKRVVPEVKKFRGAGRQNAESESMKMAPLNRREGINLVKAGFLHQKNPQRYYKYALIDPLDQPFSTFRYYYRTWNQLEALGVLSPTPSIESSSIGSCLAEQGVSPTSSVETTRSLINSLNTFDNMDPNRLDSVKSNDHVRVLTPPKKDSTALTPTSRRSIGKTTTNRPTRHHRPGTPPHSPSYAPVASTYVSTTEGVISTSASANPPSLLFTSESTTIPTSLPSSSQLLTHQSSKETFASIVRTQLPSPNPDSFRLTDLSATIEKTSSWPQPPPLEKAKLERSGGSKGVLRSVFGRDNLRQVRQQHQQQQQEQRSSTVGESGDSIRSEASSGSARSTKSDKSGIEDFSSNLKLLEKAMLVPGYDSTDKDHAVECEVEKGKGKETEQKRWEDHHGRGRSRSRDRDGRSMNLWEVV